MIDDIEKTVKEQVSNLTIAEEALMVLELAGEDVSVAKQQFDEVAAKLRKYESAIETVKATRV